MNYVSHRVFTLKRVFGGTRYDFGCDMGADVLYNNHGLGIPGLPIHALDPLWDFRRRLRAFVLFSILDNRFDLI